MVAPTAKNTIQPQTLAQAPASQEDRERCIRINEAWQAYHGELQRPLKVSADQPDDNVRTNRCSPIVDKGVSFLFGNVLKIEDGETDDEGPGDNQDFIDGLWGGNDDARMTLLSRAAINGGVCGQVFYKIVPPQGQMKYPRIVVMNPAIIRVVTAPDDCDTVLAFIIEYPGSVDLQRRQIIARIDPDGLASVAGEYDVDDTWTITDYVRKGQAGAWIQCGEQQEWPYPFPPIFCNQNLPNPNEFWGRPDLTNDIVEMNRVLNFIQSNISRIVKYHGHPITFATGVGASQIHIGVDDLICLPSPESKLEKLQAMSEFAGLLSIVEDLRSSMDEQSRVPAVALGRLAELPKGNISGVALQLLFQPLIEKTIQKQRLYGEAIRDVTRAAMVVAGIISLEEYEDYPVTLHWANLLPIDDLAAAQTALIYQQIGVSNSTIMQQLGFDPDAESEKSIAEDARKLKAYQQGIGLPPAAAGSSSIPPVPPAAQPDTTQASQGNTAPVRA